MIIHSIIQNTSDKKQTSQFCHYIVLLQYQPQSPDYAAVRADTLLSFSPHALITLAYPASNVKQKCIFSIFLLSRVSFNIFLFFSNPYTLPSFIYTSTFNPPFPFFIYCMTNRLSWWMAAYLSVFRCIRLCSVPSYIHLGNRGSPPFLFSRLKLFIKLLC